MRRHCKCRRTRGRRIPRPTTRQIALAKILLSRMMRRMFVLNFGITPQFKRLLFTNNKKTIQKIRLIRPISVSPNILHFFSFIYFNRIFFKRLKNFFFSFFARLKKEVDLKLIAGISSFSKEIGKIEGA